MWKIFETAIIWAALPYLLLIGLGLLINWPWHVIGIIAGIIAAPFIIGIVIGLFEGVGQHRADEQKLRQQHGRQAQQALVPLGIDEVPPPAGPREVQPKAKPAALPAPAKRLTGPQKRLQGPIEGIGNQWRAGLK